MRIKNIDLVMGPVDTIVEKFKLLGGGKVRRSLFKEGLVDADGVATKRGRVLARRLMADKWIADNADDIAKKLAQYAKNLKAESDDDE